MVEISWKPCLGTSGSRERISCVREYSSIPSSRKRVSGLYFKIGCLEPFVFIDIILYNELRLEGESLLMLYLFSIPYLSHVFFTASYKELPYHLTEGKNMNIPTSSLYNQDIQKKKKFRYFWLLTIWVKSHVCANLY